MPHVILCRMRRCEELQDELEAVSTYYVPRGELFAIR